MSKLKALFTGADSELAKGICIALAIVILFSSGYTVGMVRGGTNKTVNVNSTENSSSSAPDTTAPTAPSTTQPTAPSETAAPTESTPAVSDPTQQPSANVSETSAEPQPSGNASSAPQTNAEIIALFNESANKVKTNAKKVTRNYEDLSHNEENTSMEGLESIGKPLISKFLKKNETPVVSEGADIANGFPVKGESWASKATEADVAEATCTDDGSTYTVTLKFKECTDPAIGSGCGATFDIMKQEDITNAASVVQSASTRYYDAVVTCKIDKATGNMTWANYKLPMVLSVTAKVLLTINATVGMTFEHDYTIEY